MDCRYCRGGGGPNNPISIPPLKMKLGENFFGCRLCMLERGLWCPIHDLPHNEWNAGGHLCLACLHILYSRLLPQADEYYRFLLTTLPESNAAALREWAEDEDNCIPLIPPQSAEELVLWSLAALVLIRNRPFQEVLEMTAEKIDLEPVIPQGFPIAIP